MNEHIKELYARGKHNVCFEYMVDFFEGNTTCDSTFDDCEDILYEYIYEYNKLDNANW
jgi:hypothetical protein